MKAPLVGQTHITASRRFDLIVHPLTTQLVHFRRIARLTLASLLLLGMLAAAPAQVARADTWTVCPSGCDFTTIAAAVNGASDNDTILLNVTGIHTEPTSVVVDVALTIEGLGMYTTIWQAAETPNFTNHLLIDTYVNTAPLTLRNMTLRNGGSGSGSFGGTIGLNSNSTLENLYIHHNFFQRTGGSASGGAITASKPTTINHCVITDNIVQSDVAANGGAIYASSSANLVINNTTIANNQALGLDVASGDGSSSYASGGGIFLITSLTMTNSTVSGNIVRGSNVTSGTGGPGYGGGLAGRFGFTNNLNISNSTISGNSVSGGTGPTRGTAWGGGIYVHSGTLSFTTVYMNEVNGLSAKGGGLYRYSSGTTNLKNSIIANNQGAKDADGPDLYGTFTSLDYNLILNGNGFTLNGTTTHNITGTSPELHPLADNGGDTLTHAMRLSSVVVDAIPSGVNDCTPGSIYDQVGTPRPVYAGCDIGAYELPWVLYLPLFIR